MNQNELHRIYKDTEPTSWHHSCGSWHHFPVTGAAGEVFGRTSVVIINIFLKAFESGRKSEHNKLNETAEVKIPLMMFVFNLDQYKQIRHNIEFNYKTRLICAPL